LPNVKVSWEVKGVRNDAHMRKFPFKSEEVKSDLQKGKYFDPAAHDQPQSKGVSYDASLNSSLNDVVKPAVEKTPMQVNISGGSIEDVPLQKIITQPMDKSGSVADQVPVAKKAVQPMDTTGSVSDEVKKVQPKAVTVSAGKSSVE